MPVLGTSVYQPTVSPYLENVVKGADLPVLFIIPLQHNRELF